MSLNDQKKAIHETLKCFIEIKKEPFKNQSSKEKKKVFDILAKRVNDILNFKLMDVAINLFKNNFNKQERYKIVDGIFLLMFYFENLEEYEKCKLIKDFNDKFLIDIL